MRSNPALEFVYEADGGTIHTIAGNQCSFDVSDAGQTWTRFFALQTTARNVGFHGTLLTQPYTHRMPGSYNQPPQTNGTFQPPWLARLPQQPGLPVPRRHHPRFSAQHSSCKPPALSVGLNYEKKPTTNNP